ncbi:MAG: hypothetical protein K8J31_21980 [Anaerolineae bacterium]|nr:hypothetical protein [Anaerolineae bacterium]
MDADARPRKRKNEDSRESWFSHLLRFLWRAVAFCFRFGVVAPARGLWRVTLWAVKAPFRALGWLFRSLILLINGRPPEFETAREREIYRRVKRRYRRRNRLMTHLFAFILILGTAWISWLASLNDWAYRWREPYTGQVIAFTLLWAFFLIFHYVRYRMSESEDQALETALEREYEREVRSRPVYYEESQEYYGADAYDHLADEPAFEERLTEAPKVKRRSSSS